MRTMTEFDRFDYRNFDAKKLSLAKAVEEVNRLGKVDPEFIYRVVAADEDLSGFTVEKVPTIQLYFDFMANVINRYAHFLSNTGAASQRYRHR